MEGEFSGGALNGKCKITQDSGQAYTGTCTKNMPHGRGVMLNVDGTVSHKGQWIQGSPSGPNLAPAKKRKKKGSQKTRNLSEEEEPKKKKKKKGSKKKKAQDKKAAKKKARDKKKKKKKGKKQKRTVLGKKKTTSGSHATGSRDEL